MDSIVAEVERNNYRAQALINAVVMSVPFRYQGGGAAPGQAGLRTQRNRRRTHDDSRSRRRCPAGPFCEARESRSDCPGWRR